MKIHKAKGGAIFLNGDGRSDRHHARRTALQKTVDGFQGVDESLGISDSRTVDAKATPLRFFLVVDARCACG
jgi:hypothetical protein